MTHEQTPDKPNQDRTTDGSLVAAANRLIAEAHNAKGSRRNLTRGQSYDARVKTAPFTEASHFGGNLVEGLTQLVVVGDSVIGISHIRNTKKQAQGDSNGGLEKVRIALLPVGAHAEARGMSDGTAKTIQEVDMRSLTRSNEQGVVQGFQDVEIGRALLAQLSGTEDFGVSRAHAAMRVDNEGVVHITDNSTNGTHILETADYDKAHTGLSNEGQNALFATVNALNEMPAAWEQEVVTTSAGQPMRVINPEPLR